MGNFKEDIARVRGFVFDVDGVFTDNRLAILPDGEFVRSYNSKDGFVIRQLVKKGYPVCIISGGKGRALELRFEMLGVTDVYLDCFEKLDRLERFMAKHGLEADQVLFMGDDVPDIPPMRRVGMPVCPADAAIDVKAVSRYVSAYAGGEGCVRDVVEQVLRARGDWDPDNYQTCIASV